MKFQNLLSICTAAFAFACLPVVAQTAPGAEAGRSYWDAKEYFEYIPGDMPLVISVPHGGYKTPSTTPNRSNSNSNCPSYVKRIVTGADASTIELAKAVQTEFFEQFGVRPYMIIGHIARVKIDLNRPREEATCNDPDMEQAFDTWHNWVTAAVNAATQKFGRTLYFDLHGHGHKERWEIGYLLGLEKLKDIYENPDAKVGTSSSNIYKQANGNPHSLINFPELVEQRISLQSLLFGEQAFGTRVYHHGGLAVPSKEDPYGELDDEYFNGGFNTARYTGKDFPNSFGWQIEYNSQSRKEPNRQVTAQRTVKAYADFIRQHAPFASWKLPAARSTQ